MAHTGGSKSFACYADDKTINGATPSRAMVFLDTHKERKIVPTPMDEKSKQAVELINGKLSKLPNGVEETNGKVAWEGDIYSQVMSIIVGPEKKGQVRGLGRCPKSLSSVSSNQERDYHDDHDICDERIQFLECELKRVQEKSAQLEKDNAESLTQMKEDVKLLKALLLGRRVLDVST
ncbi:uncharacterized protein [Spinacia oleracea]|uniref:Uncharacterized protein isoform X2 n=1 Tax=Spinacia oleracea TaxID=3562 RepID=A0ABM3RNI7_SPIOL|nr:uncharacterized protein LOC110778431 isoform X2 [Spinacia oleracea]